MINRNFSTIVANVGSNIQDTSSAMATIIKRLANDVYFDFLRRINYEGIVSDYSFTATAKDNVLPSDFGKELSVWDSTNSIALTRTSIAKRVQDNVAAMSTTGTIGQYAVLLSPVRVQPSAAATPSLVSSSASDTTQTVYVKGISNGVEVNETVTVNGTTTVNFANSYTRYISIGKSADTAGYVTVTHGTSTIAVLADEARDHKVKIMRLYDAPATGAVINAPYIIDPSPLVNDYDVPIVDCADVLQDGATFRAWLYKRQFSKARDYKGMYEQGIDNYIWNGVNQPNDSNLFTIGTYDRDYAD